MTVLSQEGDEQAYAGDITIAVYSNVGISPYLN